MARPKVYLKCQFDINNGLTLCRACHIKVHKPRKKSWKAVKSILEKEEGNE